MLLISEPYHNQEDNPNWVSSTDGRSAISLTFAATFAPVVTGSGPGFAWVDDGSTRYYSCYWSPNPRADLAAFSLFLDGLETSFRQAETEHNIVLASDFNAKSYEWGSSTLTEQGRLLSELVASLGLLVDNVGNTPTLQRVNAESVVDVTFSRGLRIGNWKVLHQASMSDHAYITYNVSPLRPSAQTRIENHEPRTQRIGWAIKKLNIEDLSSHLLRKTPALPESDPDTMAESLNVYMAEACDASMPRRSARAHRRRAAYWWTEDIANLRKACIAALRRYQRAGGRRGDFLRIAAKTVYCESRKSFRTAIRAYQKRYWRELCQSVDSDPWGVPIRIVTKKLNRKAPGIESHGREKDIADHLFPSHPIIDWLSILMVNPITGLEIVDEPYTPIQNSKLAEAGKRLPKTKHRDPMGCRPR